MNSLAQTHLGQLFIREDNTPLYFSRNCCEWRDLYNKCAYEADHEGYPVNSGMVRIGGKFQDEGFELVRGKFAAADEANTLIERELLVDGSEELEDDEGTLQTICSTWASDASESGSIDYNSAHAEIHGYLCHMFPGYA